VQQSPDLPAVAVVMGVSGAGKTTIGRRLAERLCWKFKEGDDLHPAENVAKMRSGQPLTDADRKPWLEAVARVVDQWRRCEEHGVITCSALRRAYRRQIVGARRDVRLVYLEGSRELITQRLAARRGHFMPVNLLDSQFATLEPPGRDENPVTVDIDQSVDEIIERIVGVLFSSTGPPSSSCNRRATT
jgi:carbohydrate kinase (thermoresistant glucokinase family)